MEIFKKKRSREGILGLMDKMKFSDYRRLGELERAKLRAEAFREKGKSEKAEDILLKIHLKLLKEVFERGGEVHEIRDALAKIYTVVPSFDLERLDEMGEEELKEKIEIYQKHQIKSRIGSFIYQEGDFESASKLAEEHNISKEELVIIAKTIMGKLRVKERDGEKLKTPIGDIAEYFHLDEQDKKGQVGAWVDYISFHSRYSSMRPAQLARYFGLIKEARREAKIFLEKGVKSYEEILEIEEYDLDEEDMVKAVTKTYKILLKSPIIERRDTNRSGDKLKAARLAKRFELGEKETIIAAQLALKECSSVVQKILIAKEFDLDIELEEAKNELKKAFSTKNYPTVSTGMVSLEISTEDLIKKGILTKEEIELCEKIKDTIKKL